MSLEIDPNANFEVQPETTATISVESIAMQLPNAAVSKDYLQKDGSCVDLDPNVFFPPKGTSQKVAKSICNGCVVQDECLEYALTNRESFGIWGGKNEGERRVYCVSVAPSIQSRRSSCLFTKLIIDN